MRGIDAGDGDAVARAGPHALAGHETGDRQARVGGGRQIARKILGWPGGREHDLVGRNGERRVHIGRATDGRVGGADHQRHGANAGGRKRERPVVDRGREIGWRAIAFDAIRQHIIERQIEVAEVIGQIDLRALSDDERRRECCRWW